MCSFLLFTTDFLVCNQPLSVVKMHFWLEDASRFDPTQCTTYLRVLSGAACVKLEGSVLGCLGVMFAVTAGTIFEKPSCSPRVIHYAHCQENQNTSFTPKNSNKSEKLFMQHIVRRRRIKSENYVIIASFA